MRTRAAVAIAAAVSTVLLAYYAIAWSQVTPVRERGTDFSASYVAALLLRSGDGAELYDQQAERSRHLTLLPAGTVIDLPFITPPTTALLALPLTVLDPGTAFRVWSVIELALLALAVWVAIRAGPRPSRIGRAPRAATLLMAIAAGGTYAFLLLGQIDGLAALGLAAAYAAWRKDRPAAAGFWMALAFAATKPHLAIGLGVWLIARRDWRALGGAVAGLRRRRRRVAGAGRSRRASPGSCPRWDSRSATPRERARSAFPGWWRRGSAAAPAPATVAIAGSLIALGGCGLLGARSRGNPGALEASLAGAAALSLVASPHLLPHDLVILAPAFAWCAARAATAESRAMAGSVDDPGDRGVGRARRAHPRRHRERGARASRAARAPRTARDRHRGPDDPGVENSRREPAARVALAQSGSGRGAGGSTA